MSTRRRSTTNQESQASTSAEATPLPSELLPPITPDPQNLEQAPPTADGLDSSAPPTEPADNSEMPLATNNIPPTMPEVVAAIELVELLNAIDGYSLGQGPWDDVRTRADALRLIIGQHTST